MSTRSLCVIIAAANAERTIARAVRTALRQEFVSEVVVVDDASSDNTARSAASEEDGTGRLSIITLERNVGPAAARNIAIERSKAECFCVLDADDYLLPERTSCLLQTGDVDWDFLADDIIIVPEALDDESFSVLRHGPALSHARTLDLETFVRGNIGSGARQRHELGFLKPVMRREFLSQHGLHYDDRLRLGEDYALYVKALMAGARFRVVSACGYIAVERWESISSRHSTADLRNMVDFDQAVLATQKLSAGERAAVSAHLRATRQNSDHRYILDRKRESGVAQALVSLREVPSSLPYILSETVRGKLRKLQGLVRTAAPSAKSSIRFLIGIPGAEISRPVPNGRNAIV